MKIVKDVIIFQQIGVVPLASINNQFAPDNAWQIFNQNQLNANAIIEGVIGNKREGHVPRHDV